MSKRKNPVIDEFGRFNSYESDDQAFYSHVAKNLPANECWIWKGHKDKNGYGRLTIKGKDKRAHRISWSMLNGEISAGMIICHVCDNPSCVNPDHLFLGTHKDNVSDMIKKGRKKSVKGELNPMTRLTNEDVIEIRKWAKAGIKHGIIAYNFDIKKSSISSIVNGKCWKHLNGGMDAKKHNTTGISGSDQIISVVT